MKNILVDMLKAQGFIAAQSMEFACEHTLLSKKYEKQVQTCWYGERTSTLEVKLSSIWRPGSAGCGSTRTVGGMPTRSGGTPLSASAPITLSPRPSKTQGLRSELHGAFKIRSLSIKICKTP